MKANFPDSVPDFRLPLTREQYNDGVTEERPLSSLRIAYEIAELAKKVGIDNVTSAIVDRLAELEAVEPFDPTSHEARLRAIETYVASPITNEIAIGDVNGTNDTFQTSSPFLASQLEVKKNGLLQIQVLHYALIDDTTFVLGDVPDVGDIISCSY